MTKLEIYSLILCLIVFVVLVCVLSYMLAIIVKQAFKHIEAGLDDERILKEYNANCAKKRSKYSKAVNVALNILLCVFFGAIFLSSLYISCTQNVYFDNVPTYRVVLTSSMESKNEKNEYLLNNNLNNQLSAFDLIVTYKIPKEEDLKLYDIVVYEVDGILVVHRIVGIEEPNASHPNERHFLLQGDAVGSPDRFPVRYSQMKGIYKGGKIPFIGSFILFMQSPAGYLCLLLVLVEMISSPIITKKIVAAEQVRLALILKKKQEDEQKEKETQKAAEERKTLEERLAFYIRKEEEEAQRAIEAQRALETQRMLEEQRALEAQKALEQQRLLEAQKALEEQRMLEEQRALEERIALIEQQTLEEQLALMAQQPLEEQITQAQQQAGDEEQIIAPITTEQTIEEVAATVAPSAPSKRRVRKVHTALNISKTHRIASFHVKKKRERR